MKFGHLFWLIMVLKGGLHVGSSDLSRVLIQGEVFAKLIKFPESVNCASFCILFMNALP